MVGYEKIAATDLNFGMINLSSSCYTRKEFRAPPISGMGGASTCVDCVQKSLTVRDRRLALASNVGSVK